MKFKERLSMKEMQFEMAHRKLLRNTDRMIFMAFVWERIQGIVFEIFWQMGEQLGVTVWLAASDESESSGRWSRSK